MNNKNRGLGRGLSALMSDVNPIEADEALVQQGKPRFVPVEEIYPNPDQPRRSFDEQAMQDLTASVAEKGIIQPIIVRERQIAQGKYEIVAGERRWRAAQLAQLHEVPILVRELDDIEVLEIAIIENIQRSDLNPIDEASGYKQLMEKFGRTQEEMGKALGKSRSHIANTVRLLSLPESVQFFVTSGQLSAGHARTLIGNPQANTLAAEIVKKGLSVRDAEKISKREANKAKVSPRKPQKHKDADTVQIESDLSAQLSMKVEINHVEDSERGQIVIHYRSLSQLDDLLRLFSESS